MQTLAVLAEATHVKADEFNSQNSLVQHARNEVQQIQREILKREKKDKDLEYEKLRQLCTYEEAPNHLKFNPYIREGYRKELSTRMCIQSAFWWTNETINIWSHLFGLFLFIAITITDIEFLGAHGSFTDKLIVGSLLFCFIMALTFSSVYHMFSCRSAKDYNCFLSFDLFGIACSILAIYICGIVYAFWCHDTLRNFYVSSVMFMFGIAIALQIPALKVKDNIKMLTFVVWAIYGIVPTGHWYFEMGGLESQMVKLFIPRVIGMYLFCALAFLFYVARIPERWINSTKIVNYFGHSHNWWHLIILAAFYYWHNTGFEFLEFRLNHGCTTKNMTIY